MFSVCGSRSRAAAVFALVFLFSACGGELAGPEDRVRAVIDAMQASLENGSIQQASDLLDPRYKDRRHADKRMAVRSLLGLVHRHRNIHLFTVIRTVELTPQQDAASALVYVAMTGVPIESIEALISLKADLYRFEVRLSEVDGEWLIVGSEWERVDLGVAM